MNGKIPIHSYFTDVDLLNQTAEQVIKDFDMSGIQIKLSGSRSNAYDELFSQIHPHIERLLGTDHSKFMTILYRIDLSESLLKKKLQENSSESTSELITDLIIKRELQKVVTRNFYKRK